MCIGDIAKGIGLCLVPFALTAQPIDSVLLHEQSFTDLPFVYSVYNSVLDRNDQPFLYTTGVEHGLRIYDVEDLSAPNEEVALPPASFAGLKPAGLFQVDDLLFVSLGGFQGITQKAGLAILDVSVPESPVILDQWDSTAWTGGAPVVRVGNGHAFLGAMQFGLIILDVNDPQHIQFVSHYLPDPSWPGITIYPPNARGMELEGDTLFLAYDVGGLRAIDVSNLSQPVEIGHYLNPQQPDSTPPAYNNVRIVGDRCFIATDYCGFEVVDISDPANMQQVHWENPWNCHGSTWVGSAGHANELITARHDSLLFISGGNSELLVYDITDPQVPHLAGGWIHPNDSSVTWGLDVKDSVVVLNYIDNTTVQWFTQPYYADRGGFQLLTWGADIGTSIPLILARNSDLFVYPNPANGLVHLQRNDGRNEALFVLDAFGRVVRREVLTGERADIDLSCLPPGMYGLEVQGPHGHTISRIVLR